MMMMLMMLIMLQDDFIKVKVAVRSTKLTKIAAKL